MPDSVPLLARGLHTGAVIALAGAWFFHAAIAPVRLGRCHDAAFAVAIITGIAWLLLQTAAFAGATTVGETLAALADVAAGTQFGRASLAGLLLLVVARGVWWHGHSRWHGGIAAVPALLALLSRGIAGHAMALTDPVLLAALALHLVAAAIWLGALPPLWVVIGQEPDAAARVVRRFSRIGIVAVIVLAATGFVQGLGLIGDAPGLLGTAYGQVTLLKTVLFAALIALALGNRFVLAPALPAGTPALRRSIALETGIGVVVIGLAAWLGTLPPGLHIQPDWPLPFRIALRPEPDPDLPVEAARIVAAGVAVPACSG